MIAVLLTLIGTLTGLVTHGVGVPIQYTDIDQWAAQHPSIPFVTWRSDDCHHANAIPLVWRSELPEANCNDGRSLLLFNEPNGAGQSNLTPAEAAHYAMQHQNWKGAIYCCGTLWNDTNWKWFEEFLQHYTGRLDGIHIHPYVWWNYEDNLYGWGPRWRQLADARGLDIIVSEWAAPGGSQVETVARNKEVLPLLQAIFRPSMMFYFSWYYEWDVSDLTDGEGNLTPVGLWWFERRTEADRLYLPLLSCS